MIRLVIQRYGKSARRYENSTSPREYIAGIVDEDLPPDLQRAAMLFDLRQEIETETANARAAQVTINVVMAMRTSMAENDHAGGVIVSLDDTPMDPEKWQAGRYPQNFREEWRKRLRELIDAGRRKERHQVLVDIQDID